MYLCKNSCWSFARFGWLGLFGAFAPGWALLENTGIYRTGATWALGGLLEPRSLPQWRSNELLEPCSAPQGRSKGLLEPRSGPRGRSKGAARAPLGATGALERTDRACATGALKWAARALLGARVRRGVQISCSKQLGSVTLDAVTLPCASPHFRAWICTGSH